MYLIYQVAKKSTTTSLSPALSSWDLKSAMSFTAYTILEYWQYFSGKVEVINNKYLNKQ